MTAQAGAALNQNPAWEALNWQAIEGEVRRLQAAYREGSATRQME